MRPLRVVSVPRSVHTGGKIEVQLTKKQAVLLMHDTLPQGIKSVRALLQNQKRLPIWHLTIINFMLTITGCLRGDKLTCLTINFILLHRE